MATNLAAASRTAICNALVDQLDGAAGALKVYSGAAPDPDAAATGTLLINFALPAPAFGAASDDGTDAVATANAISDVTSSAAGTASYFRVENNGGTSLWQGSVTATGGGGDLELNTVTITGSTTCSITSWTVTGPTS